MNDAGHHRPNIEHTPPDADAEAPVGLYLHIPFCQAICSYCNFNRGLLDPALKARYVTALEADIRRAPGEPADTIFFGGGTPSLLEPDEVARLIHACRDTFDLATDTEVTLETNPETATPERLRAFADAGVNRLSFGVQSFDAEELLRLGRIHTAARAIDAIRSARTLGFASVSFDLMLWLPGQTPESWRRTVAQAIDLSPDHLSLYLLELYPNAPLKETMARAGWSQTPDDDAADMYLDALAALEGAGFVQYEISNVAKPGHWSRHNVKYWQSGSWWGFGCGAHSTVRGRRWHHVASTEDYIRHVEAGASARLGDHELSQDEQVAEALFTGLRLTRGIDVSTFERRWAVDPWARWGGELEPFVESGRMWREGGRIGLTRDGMLVANEILATFV